MNGNAPNDNPAAAPTPPDQDIRAQALPALAELGGALTRCTDFATVARLMARAAESLLGAPESELHLVTCRDGAPPAVDGAWRIDLLDAEPYRARLLVEQQPLAIPDLPADAALSILQRDRATARGLYACLALPLAAAGQCVGLWVLYRPAPQAWTAADLALATMLGAQAGLTLGALAPAAARENARLLAEARARADRLAALNAIAETLTQSLDLPTILEAALTKTLEAVGAPAGFISLADEGSGELAIRMHRGWRHPELADSLRVPPGQGLMGLAISTGEVVVSTDVSSDARVAVPALRFEGVRTMALAPMRTRGKAVGVLGAMSYEQFDFSPLTVSALRAVADQIGAAVDNARLVEAERRRLRQIEGIQATVAALSAELALESLLARLVTEAARTFDAPDVGLFLWDSPGDSLVIRASHGLSAEYVARQRLPRAWISAAPAGPGQFQSLIIDDLSRQPFGAVELTAREGLVSAMAAPLQSGASFLGVLVIYSRGGPRRFTAEELDLCTLFARYAAVAMENARLFERARQRADELALLHQVSVATTSMLDLDGLLHEIYLQVSRVLNTQSFYIALYDAESDELEFRLMIDEGRRLEPVRRPITDDSIAGWIIRHRLPVLIGDWERDAASRPAPGLIVGPGSVPRCYLGQPLVARDRIIGVISAQGERPDMFTAENQYLLAAIANQAAVAIENVQLFEETRRRVQELTALQLTTLQLTATLELSTVLETIATSTLKLISANNLHIYLYDEDRDEFTFGTALWADGRREPAVAAPRSDGLTASVIRGQRAIVIDDAAHHPLYDRPEARGWGVKAIAGFPLILAGRVLGMMSVAYLEPHHFTPDELRMLALLADHAAIAVENARLYSDVQRRLDEVSTLYNLARQTTSSLDLDTVLNNVVSTLKQALDCRGCSIALVDSGARTLEVRAAAGSEEHWQRGARLELGEGVVGRAVLEGRLIYVPDLRDEPGTMVLGPDALSLLCVPLVVKGHVIGALSADSDRREAFTGMDERLFMIAAAQASVALENAQLYQDLKARAEKLERAYDELKEIDRLKDELVQNISHELRTPLTFIKGYVDLLLEGELGPLTTAQREGLDIVAGKTNAITRLVTDIITLQQAEAGMLHGEPMDLCELAHASLAGAAMAAAERSVTLAEEYAENLPEVWADRDRLAQVFDNLLGNALKFSPNGGHIAIRITDEGTHLCVAVSDTGIGIPRDQLDKIWLRFYQVDGSARRRFGGTGLGLAIVQRIVQAHGGRVWAESELGHGSTFYFTVPKAETRQRWSS